MKHAVWIVLAAVAAYFLLNKPYPSNINLFNQTFSDPADQNSSSNDLVLALYRSGDTGDFFFIGKSDDSAIDSWSLYERYQEIYTAQGFKLDTEGNKTIGNNGKATVYLYRSSLYNGINAFVTIDADRPRRLNAANTIYEELALFDF